jgi:hypothetical protein
MDAGVPPESPGAFPETADAQLGRRSSKLHLDDIITMSSPLTTKGVPGMIDTIKNTFDRLVS